MVGIVGVVFVTVDALPVVIEVAVAECWGIITRAVGPVVVGAAARVMGVECVVVIV